jgi:hypothetical protein
MASYRFMAIAFVLMFASYATVQWLTTPRQLMPDPRVPSFHRIGTSDDPRQNQPNDSDGDEVRDGLRRAVLATADDLRESPCNDYMRDRYIAAATKYARAWLSIAPCFPHCNPNKKVEEAQLDRAKKAFDTPFDDRVNEAMYRAHRTDTIREGDFAPDVVLWVAMRSHDRLINPMATTETRKSERELREPLSCRPEKR